MTHMIDYPTFFHNAPTFLHISFQVDRTFSVKGKSPTATMRPSDFFRPKVRVAVAEGYEYWSSMSWTSQNGWYKNITCEVSFNGWHKCYHLHHHRPPPPTEIRNNHTDHADDKKKASNLCQAHGTAVSSATAKGIGINNFMAGAGNHETWAVVSHRVPNSQETFSSILLQAHHLWWVQQNVWHLTISHPSRFLALFR